jgi:ABC-type dipeptide/oligopeptide/nickel transport system permease component
MLSYFARRAGVSLVQLVGLALIAFSLIHLVPGNPVRDMLGPHATPHEIAVVSQRLGLDRSLIEQFGSFIAGLLTAHLGQSITFGQPIAALISERFLPSFVLISYGLVVAIVVGVPLAVLSAVRPGGPLDHGVRVFATMCFAMPTFWLGLVLALLLGLKLHWLPVAGYTPGFVGAIRSLTLPAIVLGLSLLVIVVRTLRSTMRKTLSTEFVEAERARGLSTSRIVLHHVMRNAVMPTVTVLAVNVGFLIGGTVVLEQVFQIPGLGSLLFLAVEHRDYPVIETVAVMAGTVVVVLSLLADLAQAIMDPRVRLGARAV